MNPSRLEAFSDAVIAVIITIMVLELKVPHSTDLAALRTLLPVFLTYVLSFLMLGIYWNNHHHLLRATRELTGGVMWANLHLLFWLSLIPFFTGWLGENHEAAWPTALYGAVLLMAAIAYKILQTTIVACHGRDSKLAAALGSDLKGKISIALYALAIVAAPFVPSVSDAIYVIVAIIWVIPDRRTHAAVKGTSHLILTLIVASAIVGAGCIQSSHQKTAAKRDLAGAWRAQVQFSSGVFAEVKDLEFMYVFNDGGTMTESSNYDASPPVPPAYGVWRRINDSAFVAKYEFYVTKPPSNFQNLSGGIVWLPDGRGVFTDTIVVASDSKSFMSTVHLELFNQAGMTVTGGGEAMGVGVRMEL